MIKTNIKMRVTPEQSAKVQEICFKNGINWGFSDDIVLYKDEPYIFIDKKKYLVWLGEHQNDSFIEAEEEEIDPELFIRTNGTCENEEFKYPMWFKNKHYDIIVIFDKLNQCKVVKSNDKEFPIGLINRLSNHTNTEIWEQVENPDKMVDEATKTVINEEYQELNKSKNNGGKTDYYQLENAPFKINDFDDFAEWRKMNGNQFNMGKAMWTFNIGRHSGTDYERDLNKIIHYANRELSRLKRGEK